MKVTFKDILSRKEWLHKELLNSLDGETIQKAADDQFYDVKLLVNGKELEPTVFNDIMNGIEKYVDAEAKSLVKEKFEEAEEEAERLSRMMGEVTAELKNKYKLYLLDFD